MALYAVFGFQGIDIAEEQQRKGTRKPLVINFLVWSIILWSFEDCK